MSRSTSAPLAELLGGGLALVSLDLALPHTHPLATAMSVLTKSGSSARSGEALRDRADARALPAEEVLASARDDHLRLACDELSPWARASLAAGLGHVARRHGALYQTGVYLRLDSAGLANLLAALLSCWTRRATTRLAHAAAGLDERLNSQAPHAGQRGHRRLRAHAGPPPQRRALHPAPGCPAS